MLVHTYFLAHLVSNFMLYYVSKEHKNAPSDEGAVERSETEGEIF